MSSQSAKKAPVKKASKKPEKSAKKEPVKKAPAKKAPAKKSEPPGCVDGGRRCRCARGDEGVRKEDAGHTVHRFRCCRSRRP